MKSILDQVVEERNQGYKQEVMQEVIATMLSNGASPEQIVALTNFPLTLVLSVQPGGAGI